ncbi:MAG: hypothetical protein IPJ65_17305 [Archangiaceae bacterium]|nr:hypothetical protein [Archangiaceae bacterium]
MRPLLLLIALASCSHPLLLKKYAATSPAVPQLDGRTVYLQPFTDARVEEWSQTQPLPDPPRYTFAEPSAEQLDQWERERRALGDGLPVSRLYSVGVVRNGFGMPLNEVFSVSSPVQWLSDATRLELLAQRAVLVDSPEGADVVVAGAVKYVRFEQYLASWVHVVLDVTVTARGAPPKATRLHVAESHLAWSGSATEIYETFCATEQKLQRYLLTEVARAAAQADATPPAL